MKVLTNTLRFLLLVFSALILVACNEQKNIAFTAPEKRAKLHSDLSWPDKSYLVIAYHDVQDKSADQRFMSVRTSALREQFAWLRENGYRPVSVADIRAAHRGEKALPKKAVLLTFDDGYQSFYTRVYPLLQAYRWPALWAPVGKWIDTPSDQKVKFGDEYVEREYFSTWQQIAELAKSPLIEIGAHTWDSHYGATGNPAGSKLPTFANRKYDPATSTYENEREYRLRIRNDAEKITQKIKMYTGRQPTAWVWPYGAANGIARDELKKLGYDTFFTLENGLASVDNVEAIPRVLINNNPSLESFAYQIIGVQENAPQRSIYVNIDNLYSADKKVFEKNLDGLIQNVKDMKISTVFLQAYVTPGGNEPVKEVYFPNRWLPVRADVFNRIAWQLQTRAGVTVFAAMPMVNWDFNATKQPASVVQYESASLNNVALKNNVADPTGIRDWQKIHEIYKDLASFNVFRGVLFMDEACRDACNTMTDQKYVELTQSLANTVKATRGYAVKTARQLVAEPAFKPSPDTALTAKLTAFQDLYDLTVLVVNPYTSALHKNQRDPWLQLMSTKVASYPNGREKLLVQLDMPHDKHAGDNLSAVYEITNWMEIMQLNGVRNYGYNPGGAVIDERQVQIIAPNFSTNWYPENE